MTKSKVKRGLFAPIKTRKISDEVYKQIVASISSGQFKPGEKIPSEREMASELGISRQSLREALHRAEVMGLIKVRQGEGSFIRSSVHEPLKPALTVIIEKEAEKIFEFLEIRKLIEGWCAEKAAREANAEDLDYIRAILDQMKTIGSKDKRWEEMDVAFHLAIAEASHNVIAMHIMEALKVNFGTFFRFRNSITSSEKTDLLWQHHNEIFQAICSRNPALAKQKLVDHLDFIESKIKADMGKMKNG
ncbi:MAG: FadR family transcriptional regulator [Desulfobacterales bacterium]|nr:MAG: FadR family transcriptional regulator [Desulfobacterales bacterium]